MSSAKDTEKDLYFVAVKALLRDGDKLLIIHDVFGEWDVPGGRLQSNEFNTSFEEVMERKIREELGNDVRYKLGSPKVFFRHQRKEHGLGGQTVRIFAIGYEANYLGGEVNLCDYLDECKWVDITTLAPDQYFAGGWLQGIKEYQEKSLKL